MSVNKKTYYCTQVKTEVSICVQKHLKMFATKLLGLPIRYAVQALLFPHNQPRSADRQKRLGEEVRDHDEEAA